VKLADETPHYLEYAGIVGALMVDTADERGVTRFYNVAHWNERTAGLGPWSIYQGVPRRFVM